MPIRIGAVAIAALALAACAPDFNPPPDYKGGYLVDTDRSRTVTVAARDTLYLISRRYDVPTKVIAERNGLKPPYALTVGQSLILDPTRVHTVVQGDTLASVAQRYGVDAGALAAANDLAPPYQLRAGLELWIPDPFTSVAIARNVTTTPSADELPPISTAPTSNRPISSETLPPVKGAIVEAPGTGLSAPSQPATPPPAAAVSEAPLSTPIAVQPAPPVIGTPPVAAAPTPAPASPPALAPAPAPERDVALAVPRNAIGEPAPRAGSDFAWPVVGKVVARFGPAGKGLHNDGINIAAPTGTQVRAADNGVVAYAGNELKGFGNLLLIKHADGWTTAYAHNDKLLVARGDKVMRGQVIATVGRTGNVDSPQLHFEVRKGTQAMDPMEYLTKAGGG